MHASPVHSPSQTVLKGRERAPWLRYLFYFINLKIKQLSIQEMGNLSRHFFLFLLNAYTMRERERERERGGLRQVSNVNYILK